MTKNRKAGEIGVENRLKQGRLGDSAALSDNPAGITKQDSWGHLLQTLISTFTDK
jgi:hypothetical protein